MTHFQAVAVLNSANKPVEFAVRSEDGGAVSVAEILSDEYGVVVQGSDGGMLYPWHRVLWVAYAS